MKILLYITITIYTITLFSCSKADNITSKYAGPKNISRYQWIKADSISGEFNHTIYDIDTLGKVILWDNSSDTYNNAYFYTSIMPAGFGLNNVGTGYQSVGWYVDGVEAKSLTFFSEPNPGHVNYCIYTLNKKLNGKLILEAVFGSGTNMYKEIIELTPLSED